MAKSDKISKPPVERLENEEKIIQADFAEVLIDGNEGINPKFEQALL